MAPGRTLSPSDTIIHATAVAYAGRAAVIQGAAGSGKSGLALQLIALGAELVADDRTILTRKKNAVIASCPSSIHGRIEARGVGILAAPVAEPTPIALIVDMNTEEAERLPPWREADLLDLSLPLQRKVDRPHFPAAILSYLMYGRIA